MLKNYRCFIASPSDTQEERNICDRAFDHINKTLGKAFDFRIDGLKWESDTYPAIGADGQDVINKQIGNNYDIFIGIMCLKFGTPTLRAGSGTEEEFNIALERYREDNDLQIMFYFNDNPGSLKQMDLSDYKKVQDFKDKLRSVGALYHEYDGTNNFEKILTDHLVLYFNNIYKHQGNAGIETSVTDGIKTAFERKLNASLSLFNDQPIIWVDPILSETNEISANADDNYNNRVDLKTLINNPESTIIKAPPQFGLTSLARYLVLEAWKGKNLWIYIDNNQVKPHNITNAVIREASELGQSIDDVKVIILDAWSFHEKSSLKKLKAICESYPHIPIIVMQTIDDSKFLEDDEEDDENDIEIKRDFSTLHLLALSRTLIRSVVKEYTKKKLIGEENIVLNKVLSDLETLNIHRTPHNCLTLLKVCEKHFDESPVNRTKMLEMVLFVLFYKDDSATYKTKPDLKDCEFILGHLCENLIRRDQYEFTSAYFMQELNGYCRNKLIDVDIEDLFEILTSNNIIVKKDTNFSFRSAFWIFYFAAKRMHSDRVFCDYIFSSKKYVSCPEIVEFYTGIDRNRSDALKILIKDIHETSAIVNGKLGLPDNVSPLTNANWQPTEEAVKKMTEEIGEDVLNSKLPDNIKDQYADSTYNQLKPYVQTIQTFFEEYSLYSLMQKIRACSRALRNSDYVEPELKKEALTNILYGWEQVAKVLFAISPILADKGFASFEGTSFTLAGNFGNTMEERIKRIMLVNPVNVVGIFKDDIFSPKIGPLLFEQFQKESNPTNKHHLALLLILERPRLWKTYIEDYIISLNKNSFYLYDLVNNLRSKYRFDFVDSGTLREIEYLIKMGFAKHEFGDKKPGLDKIKKISNNALPKRQVENDE